MVTAMRWAITGMLAWPIISVAQEPARAITPPDAESGFTRPAVTIPEPRSMDDFNVSRGSNTLAGEPAMGDPGAGPPEDIEKLFAIVLRNNPDIRAAQAEVDAVMARADKLRGEMLQKVATLDARRRSIKATLANMPDGSSMRRQTEESLRATTEDLRATLGMGPMGMSVSQLTFGDMSADLAMGGGAVQPTYDEKAVRPTVDEKVAVLLDMPVSLAFEDIALTEILLYMSESLEYSFVCDPLLENMPIARIALSNVPFRQALLALSDIVPGTVFVIREYGIFATTREQAATLAAPTIPDIPLYEPAPPAALRLNHAAPRRVEIRKVAPPVGGGGEHTVELHAVPFDDAPVPREAVP